MSPFLFFLIGMGMTTLLLTAVVGFFPQVLHGTREDDARRAAAWYAGYDQGVEDERNAAAVDWPKYRMPRRNSPYGPRVDNSSTDA